MVMSDFRPDVEIWPFRACAMHPAIIIETGHCGLGGQMPRSTERISSFSINSNTLANWKQKSVNSRNPNPRCAQV